MEKSRPHMRSFASSASTNQFSNSSCDSSFDTDLEKSLVNEKSLPLTSSIHGNDIKEGKRGFDELDDDDDDKFQKSLKDGLDSKINRYLVYVLLTLCILTGLLVIQKRREIQDEKSELQQFDQTGKITFSSSDPRGGVHTNQQMLTNDYFLNKDGQNNLENHKLSTLQSAEETQEKEDTDDYDNLKQLIDSKLDELHLKENMKEGRTFEQADLQITQLEKEEKEESEEVESEAKFSPLRELSNIFKLSKIVLIVDDYSNRYSSIVKGLSGEAILLNLNKHPESIEFSKFIKDYLQINKLPALVVNSKLLLSGFELEDAKVESLNALIKG